MIPRVTDVERVEVGKVYLVPCVQTRRLWVGWNDPGPRLGWLPVIGPPHEDAAILRFPTEHYHYDWRFVSAKQARIIGVRPSDPVGLARVERAGDVTARSHHPLRCLRKMPTFPLPHSLSGFPLDALEQAHATARIKPDCRVCPHRGIPLNGLPERDHVVVCPGHGLAWNVDTGALVPRVGSVAA